MNRDTLYSAAVVDISKGATLTLPEAGGRYMTAAVINEDHYMNRVIGEPGTYELTMDEYDTPFVMVTIRTLIDPGDPADVAEVNALQDAIVIESVSNEPYTHPEYDEETRIAIVNAFQPLIEAIPDSSRSFGSKDDVDPVRHLLMTASGWGGLLEREAYYYIETEPRPAGRYTFTFGEVPVNAFWSLTIYNRDGFFEANPRDSYILNSLTAMSNEDGPVTINLGPEDEGLPNFLFTPEGWNYVIRLYEPQQVVLDGDWTPPVPVPVA
jgi:hypothetical protein